MRRVGMLVLLVAVAIVWFVVVEPDTAPTDAPQNPSAQNPSASPSASDRPVSPPLTTPPSSAERSLPVQARETIALIDAGGPFPYDRDGVVFENRERLLPSRERGYWREYTVPTPGSSDRGARRLVEGRDGELYYTDDHYASFRRIRGPGGAS